VLDLEAMWNYKHAAGAFTGMFATKFHTDPKDDVSFWATTKTKMVRDCKAMTDLGLTVSANVKGDKWNLGFLRE